MDRNSDKEYDAAIAGSPPSEAWLFAQVILGKPIPSPYRIQAAAHAKREQLELLAPISTWHANELRRQLIGEAEVNRQREQLQWLAEISARHECELQAIQCEYKLRDDRFKGLAIDYKAHHGYEDWHRELDKEVTTWIKKNPRATEATFETWLRERYAKPDLKSRFPKGLSQPEE
jgi:hypothetical protein